MTEGTAWFRRLVKDCKKISPHIRIKRIKLGFYRIYWKQAYIHEIYKEMPQNGHDIEEVDPMFEDKEYGEKWEDQAEMTRKIKNYVEGYFDSLDRIRTRSWLMKHDDEYNKKATQAYKQMVVK